LTKNHSKSQEEKPEERRGVTIHRESPFMPDLKIKHRKIINKRGDMMLVRAETGEIESQVAGFWELEEVDSTQFVKIFAAGMKRLKDLKSPGVRVLEILYLIIKKNPGKDRVFMSFNNVDQLLTPISVATYRRGTRELIECEFIAATVDANMYWINPAYFFNGDRLTLAKTYYLKDTEPPIKELTSKSQEIEQELNEFYKYDKQSATLKSIELSHEEIELIRNARKLSEMSDEEIEALQQEKGIKFTRGGRKFNA
jgi:hypothetical protein